MSYLFSGSDLLSLPQITSHFTLLSRLHPSPVTFGEANACDYLLPAAICALSSLTDYTAVITYPIPSPQLQPDVFSQHSFALCLADSVTSQDVLLLHRLD
ncbi:unnamed protein product [Danaus chrysippus]|uniref:(African queen) hypothetical protein n=1 Tax=Danaus chrysippus TaxID=151541 RepID=A0A8J2WF29_9NEOP|nr:unnamed protein product [Danaus chrysippus]